jgi:putative peptide zinc metalloprotease protein
MTATADPPVSAVEATSGVGLDRADGLELLGPICGSGYRDGAALVRRRDGQMVQLGPLMYTLLECVDGRREAGDLARAVSERIERRVSTEHVVRLAEKLAGQGLLAGTEHEAPPRRNPLLALRWKVLVTNPEVTRRLTAPFTILFRPWLMWPTLAAFVAVFWFVLVQKGVASATAQAFDRPGLLLLVFALAVASAGFHELGHAAACRYGGATPAGMGMGLYLVWPAFYTDVTDAYRLPQRDRLRVDLGGLYFNAVVADLTLAVWLIWRADALLLLVALQVLQMVKQLSPVIRADGYHILSDATGVPDLYSQMGPTLRRLVPGHHREPSALTGRARLLVTAWVLIIVPVLVGLSIGAILVLPRLATSAWDSGRHIVAAIPTEAGNGQILDLLASLVRLLALALPVGGSVLVTQRVVRTTVSKASSWSRGKPGRRAAVLIAGAAVVAGLVWAWWPAGQYQPVRANERGTLGSLVQVVSSPQSVARPGAVPVQAQLTPGTHLAVAMIPVGGATRRDPALFVIPTGRDRPAVAIISSSAPKLPATARGVAASTGAGAAGGATTTSAPPPTPSANPPPSSPGTASSPPTRAMVFPFILPPRPGPGGTQALAVGTQDHGVTYAIAYALVTVSKGKAVTETNSAYALANCQSCTTVAVSFQVVLVVGRSKIVTPINVAEALNDNCPACMTTAVADQIVVTLSVQPSAALLAKLNSDLSQLGALPKLGANGTPTAIAAAVATVQQEIDTELKDSGSLSVTGTSAGSSTTTSTGPPGASTSTSTTSSTAASTTTTPASATTPSAASTTSSSPTTTAGSTQSTTPQASGSSQAQTSTATSTSTTSPSPSTNTTQTQSTSTSATTPSSGSDAATTTTTTTTTP